LPLVKPSTIARKYSIRTLGAGSRLAAGMRSGASASSRRDEGRLLIFKQDAQKRTETGFWLNSWLR